jgi:hypothetical protein
VNKLSTAQASSILKQASVTIRGLKEENDDLREKLAASDKETRIEKLAKVMEDKGLNDALSFEEKVAELRGKKNLEVTEEAVKLASPQHEAWSLPDDNDGVPSGTKSAFETFIETGESPD